MGHVLMLAIAHSEDVCELGDCQNGVGILHFGELGTRYEGSFRRSTFRGRQTQHRWLMGCRRAMGRWKSPRSGHVYLGRRHRLRRRKSPMPRGVVLPSARPLNRLLSAERINQIHVPSQEWSKNAMHGSGVLRSASGSIFEGEWFNNTCTGYGASLSTNGETYEVRCILQVSHNSSRVGF